MSDLEVQPTEVGSLLSNGWTLLDVRRPDEVALAPIPGALHVPMDEVPDKIDTIRDHQPLAVICHHGVRSMRVTMWLTNQQIECRSVAGGSDLWSQTVDPGVPRY
ncbi:MAG: hypothetical protein KDA28_07130 [Phycisphaerales bacterium]|nr:hypothetical protein [Phycisphaerales bacterium]